MSGEVDWRFLVLGKQRLCRRAMRMVLKSGYCGVLWNWKGQKEIGSKTMKKGKAQWIKNKLLQKMAQWKTKGSYSEWNFKWGRWEYFVMTMESKRNWKHLPKGRQDGKVLTYSWKLAPLLVKRSLQRWNPQIGEIYLNYAKEEEKILKSMVYKDG